MEERRQLRAVPLFLVGIFVLLAGAIGVAGLKYYQVRTQSLKGEIQKELTGIASLKIDQIAEWRRERLDDARDIALEAENHRAAIRALLADPRPQAHAPLLAWIEGVKARYRFAGLAVADGSGREVLTTEPEYPLGAEEAQVARLAADSARPVLSDFLVVKGRENRIGLDLAIALTPPDEGRDGTGAVLVMRIDPRRRLYALVQSWPTSTRSAETLLIRREGEEVVFLNELRFRPDSALRLRLPVSAEQLPAAAAARGQQGPFEGRDYRGVLVLAVLRPVPDTAWSMVAKIDREEIYAPLRAETQTILAFVLLLIGSAGIGLAYLWKRQTTRFFQQRYQEENAMRMALLASERERDRVIAELKEALAQVKTLSGILPICASCKKIRDDQGYWQQVESYIREHSEAEFSHGICPECVEKLYPGYFRPGAPQREAGAGPAERSAAR